MTKIENCTSPLTSAQLFQIALEITKIAYTFSCTSVIRVWFPNLVNVSLVGYLPFSLLREVFLGVFRISDLIRT